MSPAKVLLLALLLSTAALTGCLGGQDPPAEETAPMATGSGGDQASAAAAASEPLGPESSVQAPTWEVGQFWSWHHDDRSDTFDWDLVVVEDLGQAWQVAPDAAEPARFNAMFDWYVFGEMSKDRVTDEDAGGLVFYEFPLTDGKTWTSTFGPEGPAWEVTHQATFDPAIETEAGALPGFQITATVNGTLFFAYDYIPEIGWFSQLTNHVLPEEGGDGGVDWTYTTTDWGTGWTGTVHVAQAEMIANAFHEVDLVPERADATPAPHASFTVAEDADALFAVGLAGTTLGATQTTLVDPNRETHQLTAVSTSLDGEATFMAHFLEPVAGDWEVLMGGAGADTEGFVLAWQTFTQELQL